MTEKLILDRPPRIQPELPSEEIEIPPPPKKEHSGLERLVQLALPLITIIGYVLVASLGGRGRSPWLMIPMALSVVASTIFAFYSYRREKQRQTEIEQAYADRLVEMNRDMQEYHDQQRRFYNYNYPDRVKLFSIVRDAKEDLRSKQRRLRSHARIYERRVEDTDFGTVRLGMGTLPSTVRYVLKDAENFEDRQVREALKLQGDSQYVSNIPVIINLRDANPDATDESKEETGTPFSHAIGIAGEVEAVHEFVRFLLAQYVVFHAPTDAKLYVLGNRQGGWKWLEHLPHSQSDEHNQYVCFAEDYDNQSVGSIFEQDSGSGIELFLEGLRSTLAQRKIRLQDREENQAGADPRQPFLLVVIDLLDSVYNPASPLKDLDADAAVSILLEEGSRLGAAVLFLVPERSKIPSRCRSIIEIERTTPATNSRSQKWMRLHFRYAETGVNTYRYVGRADRIGKMDLSRRLARDLSEVEVKQGYGANLVSALPFLDLMNVASLSDLMQKSQDWWQESEHPARANWLRVKFARMSGNKDRTLVFSAKQDGVHGMIAGSTGSGKSEILLSMITGMAVTYQPSMLNFVLVDYKGGGAFAGIYNEQWKLPHCVDLITNLQGNAVTRMFTAISAELQRRQVLLRERDVKHIVEYYERGMHRQKPLPFLFIIIDEFAEMIADRSEYKSQLESITRIGRSLGVSLILAAQNPSGVTDQMRSNIKFRICLRVETPAQSRELLRKTDAAFLPSIPGRGYLQVGNDEIELIQVAYTGEKYRESEAEAVAYPVLWPDRRRSQGEADEPLELYKLIAQRLQEQASTQRLPEQRAPWPDFLPEQLALNQPLAVNSRDDAGRRSPVRPTVTSGAYLQQIELLSLGQPAPDMMTLNPFLTNWSNEPDTAGWVEEIDWLQYAMRPVVGLIDDPYGARQIPLCVNLRQGHTVLYGASGWGKSVFIRSLALSLASTHSPNRLHMYLLDLGGRTLSVLSGLPHVGSVITPDEEGYEERVVQLLRMLEETINDRKEMVSATELANIYEYNANHPDQVQPSILVAVDNFFEFSETFQEDTDDEHGPFARFVNIARQSRPYGIHFVVTANQTSVLNNQLASIFAERLTLKLNDPAEYRGVVGSTIDDIEGIPGRGYIQIDRVPLAFQVALPFESSQQEGDSQAISDRMQEFVRNMALYVTARKDDFVLPKPIKALPQSVLFRQLLGRERELATGDQFLIELEASVVSQWATSMRPEEADWLSVPIGITPGDYVKNLRLEAKRDGVHGLVAGGTGAGKSELLMTLIVGLAFRYDPTILNFVLIDYKGGGAFQPFANLPHCVDIVTNLNKSSVVRMFTAIRAEMQRRQKLNTDTGAKDIIDYRAKNLHMTHAPYPHLFIIIDEYAEMISDTPEFRDELESITRVGRSLGVNLLLASQRPIGVTDQMRANIKYRICLRVEQTDTSREMLRRPDAALLPSGMPGRGYIQVGSEHIELLQVAYTGDDVAEVENDDGKPLKFYEVAVNICNRIWESQHKTRPGAPWPPFPSSILTFSIPIAEQYVPDETDRQTMDRDKSGALTLNDRIGRWTDGAIAWPEIEWRRQAMRAAVGLLDDPYNSQLRPLLVDLKQGHGIIFGGSGWGKTTFLRSLILSLAATHSPSDLHVHLIDMGGRNLETLGLLPQVGTVILPDEPGYEERIQQMLRELHDLMDQRRKRFSEAGVADFYEYNQGVVQGADRLIAPAILFVLDNFTEFVETFGNRSDQDDPDSVFGSFVALARQGKSYGVHIIVSATQVKSISSKLYSLFTERFTLRLADGGEYSAIVGGRVEGIDPIPGRGYARIGRRPLSFQVALHPGSVNPLSQEYVGGDRGLIQRMSDNMQSAIERMDLIYEPPLKIDALPTSSLYRALLTEERSLSLNGDWWDSLKDDMRQQWLTNSLADSAEWLQAPIGVISGNRTRTIRFEARLDGVHGMIAGGTGSGKSELLMTLILGLAFKYSPDILNFVLVDFKGGGAFKPFETLPHCVSIVTNLNASAVDRMFTAINAEMKRRQALNQRTNTKDIVDYRRRGFHLNGGEPYPHLFVIIDEYAEMIDSNPEYRAELESITRVGRAQGVNLILASQKPKGVTDQMRANIKLRICLRVEEPETSREMLRRPDAAQLPNGIPGRGYIQVGNDNIELIQVSWTGDSILRYVRPAVEWPEHIRGLDDPAADQEQDGTEAPFYEHAVSLITEVWQEQFVPKPWPDFLPEFLSLQKSIVDTAEGTASVLVPQVSDWLNGESPSKLWASIEWSKSAACTAVGLVDDPQFAQQRPLQVDFKRGHYAILGDSGYGKTSLMRSILVGLAATHSPKELHTYVVDLGGHSFSSVEGLPHVGSILYSDEETFDERLNRLLAFLEQMQRSRQQLIGDANTPTIYEFNQRYPKDAKPLILVVIDNFAELQQNYELLVDSTLIPLARTSVAIGIVFLISANQPNDLSSKLYNLLSQRFTFHQTNRDRYMEIVGRGAIDLDEIPGRGYTRFDGRPLQFQAATPVGLGVPGGMESLSEGEELKTLAQNMRIAVAASDIGSDHLPLPVQTLARHVDLESILREAPAPGRSRTEAVIGRNDALLPALIDLEKMGNHFAILGHSLSGKTTALYSWVFSLAQRYDPTRVAFVLVDFRRKFANYGGARTLTELPHVLESITRSDDLAPLLEQLQAEGEVLQAGTVKRRVFVFIDNYDDFSQDLDTNQNNMLARLVRSYGQDGIHLVIAGAMNADNKAVLRLMNHGVVLRSLSLLQANHLRVHRSPRNAPSELGVGRGYFVQAGDVSLVQIASPYPAIESEVTDDEADESRWACLDRWVEQICQQFPNSKAGWSKVDDDEDGTAPSLEMSERYAKRLALAKHIMRVELQRSANGDGSDLVLTKKIVSEGIDTVLPESRLIEAIRQRLIADNPEVAIIIEGYTDQDVIINAESVYRAIVVDKK